MVHRRHDAAPMRLVLLAQRGKVAATERAGGLLFAYKAVAAGTELQLDRHERPRRRISGVPAARQTPTANATHQRLVRCDTWTTAPAAIIVCGV